MVRLLVFFMICFSSLFSRGDTIRPLFYTDDGIRCRRYQYEDDAKYEWVFIPGGPGLDSLYFTRLLDHLKLPGIIWIVDMPEIGDNSNLVEDGNYDAYFEMFSTLFNSFESPIVVGHSFGAKLALLAPELEKKARAFICLNSTPKESSQQMLLVAEERGLPDLQESLLNFLANPSNETFGLAFDKFIPYYFSPESLEEGSVYLKGIPFNYASLLWWLKRSAEVEYNAQWIPQNVPMLVITGGKDSICPASVFISDERFDRDNITFVHIEEGGHFSWVEKPDAVKKAFDAFVSSLQ